MGTGMVSLGTLGLDGTKLAGNAANKANRTLPQIEKVLAGAAEKDAADDACQHGNPQPATPGALARRADRAISGSVPLAAGRQMGSLSVSRRSPRPSWLGGRCR